MQTASRWFRRGVAVTAVAVLATSVTATAATTASAATPGYQVVTPTNHDGWVAAPLTSAATASASLVLGPAPTPAGAGSYRLATGAGEPGANKGGKPVLYGTAYAAVPLGSIESLGYSTYVDESASPGLAPSLGMGVQNAGGWRGTLVFEPIYNGTPELDAWQQWDATAGQWWFTRDIVDTNGTVVIPRQTTKTLAELRAAFDANPALYGDLVIDGGGVQLYAGQASYSASWSGFVGHVDGVTVTTSTEAATYDFEYGLDHCDVSVIDTVISLRADCTTDHPLFVADGYTLNGAGHTITAVNPVGGVFSGAVIDVVDATATIMDLTVTTSGMDDPSANSGGAFYGIRYLRSGGSLSDVTITNITHGNGVQEGIGLFVRNRPASGPNTFPYLPIALDDVTVERYQKAGVVLDGHLDATATGLRIGAAGTSTGAELDDVIAANALQISRGANADVSDSHITGNEYDGPADAYATAVILFGAGEVVLHDNVIDGSTDVGVSVFDGAPEWVTGTATVTRNVISRVPDGDPLDRFGSAFDVDTVGTVVASDNLLIGWATVDEDVDNVDTGALRPSAVTDLEASAAPGSIEVVWTDATAPGAAPLTGYTVSLLEDGDLVDETVVTSPSASFTHAYPNHEYTVEVTATNAAGIGPTTSVDLDSFVPSAPADLSITGGAGQVTVCWEPAEGDVEVYLVELVGTGRDPIEVEADQELSVTFDDLALNAGYAVSVTAYNGWGPGQAASASFVTTLPAQLDMGSVVVAGGAGSATVSWPATSVDSDIEGYRVTMNGQTQQVAASSSNVSFEGLVAGKTYLVSVQAINAWGAGPVTTVTYSTAVPGSPASLRVVGGVGRATVSWGAATSTGAPVTGYVVSAVGGPTVTLGADARSTVLTGLTIGKAYSFTVTALNPWGSSPAASKALVGNALTAVPSTRAVTYGGAVTLRGVLTSGGKPVSRATVTVYGQRAGTTTWALLGVTGTSATGAYAFTTKPSATTVYSVQFLGSTTHMGTAAPRQVVQVATAVSASLNRSSVARNGVATISGSVAPKHAGQAVALQVLVGRTWKTVTSATLSSTSTYSFKVYTGSRGSFSYRVVKPKDVDHAIGVSPVRVLRVV